MKQEWLPKGKTLWLLFDTANGDRFTRRYVWWFDSRKAAMEHRRWQHKHPGYVRLSMPVKVRIA